MACMVMLSSDYSSRLASFTSIFIVRGIQSHNSTWITLGQAWHLEQTSKTSLAGACWELCNKEI